MRLVVTGWLGMNQGINMRSGTSLGALIAMIALLGGSPATLYAQNGGWATPKGEEAFEQNRFPELKGLTYSQQDQRKAISLCAQYGGGSQSRLCNLSTEFYMKEGQQEADVQRQKEASAAQVSAQTEQSSIDDEASVPPAASQESATALSQAPNNAEAVSVATASSSTEKQASEHGAVDYQAKRQAQEAEIQAQRLEEVRIRTQAEVAHAQRVKQQQDALNQARAKMEKDAAAKSQQKEERDEKTALYWKVGILGFLVSNIILFVGAAKKKFVVFYDKWDIIHTALIFVSPLCGYFLAWLIDVGTSGESFLHPVCIGLGWVLAIWFSVVTLISSIRHNKNVTIGIFVGLMKIYTVVLIAAIALLSFTMLTSTMDAMPKDMHPLEKMQRVKQNKENGAMWAAVAAILLYLLVNGAEVYEVRGWRHPS